MDRDLSVLEQKLASLIAHTRALRAANEELRRELGDAHKRNRALSERMQQAASRLDALLEGIAVE